MEHDRYGQGPPVVAVHGLGLTRRDWHPLREHLAAHRELIGVDLPGFGESTRPVGARGITPLVDALEAWLDEQGLDQPHLVGNSMGGRIVLELAGRGRAASVTAISPAGFNSEIESVGIHANLFTVRAVTRRVAPVAGTLSATALGRAALLSVAVARPGRLTPDQATGLIRGYAGSAGFRPAVHDVVWGGLKGLDRISCPVTVLWGTRDLILPVSGAGRAEERLPGARVERLTGLGHISMYDDPERVASALLDATSGSR